MRALILTTQVPFVRGGAEVLAEGLCNGIKAIGHDAVIVAIPFADYPLTAVVDQMLACRLLHITRFAGKPIDRVIGLKFPAYYVPHPNKVMWIVHQHKSVYEFWNHTYGASRSPDGAAARAAIREADQRFIPEARAVYTISETVSRRMRDFCKIDSTPLYPPVEHPDQYYCDDAGDYLFFPSRINPSKRQDLVIKSLVHTKYPVRVHFAGSVDDAMYAEHLASLIADLGLENRIEMLGYIDEQTKEDRFARSLGVVFPPEDEDYGYVTIEAMLSHKPVITCTDSGGALELVVDEQTGYIREPTPEALAIAMDMLWEQRSHAKEMGRAGHQRYEELDLRWERVAERLMK